jgi:hypothetical protein
MTGCCPIHEDVMLTYQAIERNKGQWICEVCEKARDERLRQLFGPVLREPKYD